MTTVGKFLSFELMVSPLVLQLLFWAGIGGTLYGSYVLIQLGHWAWPFPLVFGPLLVRVIFERAILSFRSYDRLVAIEEHLLALKNREA